MSISGLEVANPNIDVARMLRRTVNDRLIKSLKALVISCEEALGRSFKESLNFINNIVPDHKISPFAFIINKRLMESIEIEDANSVTFIIENDIARIAVEEKKNLTLDELDSIYWGHKCTRLIENYFTPVEGIGSLNISGNVGAQRPIFLQKAATALRSINDSVPILGEEISTYVSHLLFCDSPGLLGASSIDFFGCIIISPTLQQVDRLEEFLIEHIVHEAGHLHLNAVLCNDPLTENDQEERIVSPVRKDLRPINGVFHAMFVMSRVVWALRHVRKRLPSNYIDKQIGHNQTQFYRAVAALEHKAKFTQVGRALLDSCRDLVA